MTALRAAARTLRLDAAAGRLIRDLRERGTETILLKGRSIAERLYPGEHRPYVDVDLLVAPGHQHRVGTWLAAAGHTRVLAGAYRSEQCGHADTWHHPGTTVTVDVHHTLAGTGVDSTTVWAALRAHTRPLAIGPEPVPALDDTGLALTVALHAAQHGAGTPRPLADLDRALGTFDRATFDAAAELADRLGARAAFATGLALVPRGRSLAARYGAGTRPATLALCTARGTASIAVVLGAGGWRRPRILAQRLFPSRTLLRRSMPLARRGRAGLLAAYAVRPLWMAWKLPAALRDWRNADRDG